MNLYAILTLVMIFYIAIKKNADYGPMYKAEALAAKGINEGREEIEDMEEEFLRQTTGNKGKIMDLVIPICALIVLCVLTLSLIHIYVIQIHIPPLCDRKDDIIPLIEFFVKKNNERYGLHKQFHPCALEALVNYSWPGNIRELSNIVERTFMTSDGDVIQKEALPQEILREQKAGVREVNDLNRCV